MTEEFRLPDFLKNQSAEEIHQRMLSNLPDDIDSSVGGFPSDFTMPTAIEKAEMVEFSLAETIKNIFPQWADDSALLDYHAQTRGIKRKAAVSATAALTIIGEAGTRIPSGFTFCTEATNDVAAVEFEVMADVVIPDNGTLNISVSAVEGGMQGNVSANSITLQVKPLNGIKSVTNPHAAIGGEDEEADDALRKRVVEYDQTQGQSFVGSQNDYKRWALEVDGVGAAKVVLAQDDTGLVTIIITDAAGNPASSDLCTAVYNHIASPDDDSQRLAPVNGAVLSVITPAAFVISVSATVKLETSYTIGGVQSAFLAALKAYLLTCTDDVKYNKICSLLMDTQGVSDYSDVLLNGDSSNISLTASQLATTDSSKVVLSSAS